ncbi:MAG: SIS domain-containing protein [Ruminococcaceae bacterium]|nr:SIS domain-containing protein [Oscillospiraceae bacterium]
MYEKYFARLKEILLKIEDTQGPNIEAAADVLVQAIRTGHCVYAFGCNHANLLAKELVYRTGGLAVINTIEAPGLDFDVRPATLTTDMERLHDYGAILVRAAGIKTGDVFIIHSESGRNAVTVDAARQAKEIGATVICLTNLDYSRSVSSRHASGKRLFEVSDIVLDNCGDIGDTVVDIPELGQKVAASSTAAGAALLQALVAEVIARMVAANELPPVFISSNMEGGDEHNKKIMEQYKSQIKYL